MSDLRTLLRHETREHHEALDARVGGHDPFSDARSYAEYLRAMRSLYVRFGDSLDHVSREVGLPAPSATLIAAIDDDRRSAGDDASEEALAAETSRSDRSPDASESDPCESDPCESAPCESARYGHAYVLEGSAMGANFLRKDAEERLPAGLSADYLAALAAGAKTRWPTLISALNERPLDPQQTIDAAIDVFQYATQQFAKHA